MGFLCALGTLRKLPEAPMVWSVHTSGWAEGEEEGWKCRVQSLLHHSWLLPHPPFPNLRSAPGLMAYIPWVYVSRTVGFSPSQWCQLQENFSIFLGNCRKGRLSTKRDSLWFCPCILIAKWVYFTALN